MVALALTGCGGSGAMSDDRSAVYDSDSFGETSNVVGSDQSDGSGGRAYDDAESVSYDMSMAEDAEAKAVGNASPEEPASPESPDAAGDEQALGSMIRRNADIELTTKKYDEADRAIDALIKKYSLVTLEDNATKNTSYYGSSTSYRTRRVRIRVRREQFDEFCDAIGAASETWDIDLMNKSSEDVTKQYNDNSQRIDALKTRYEWYKQRVEQTQDENVARGYSDDMFEALEQITYLENANNDIETDVAYSIISIRLTEDVGTSVDVDKADDVWATVGEELSVLPENIKSVFGGFVLFLIRAIPSILVLMLIALVVLLIVKAFRGYRRKHPVSRPIQMPNGAYPAVSNPGGMMPQANPRMGHFYHAVPAQQPMPPQQSQAPAAPAPMPQSVPAPVPQQTGLTTDEGTRVDTVKSDQVGPATFEEAIAEAMTNVTTDEPLEDDASTSTDDFGTVADDVQEPNGDEEAPDIFSASASVSDDIWGNVPDATYLKIDEMLDEEDTE